MPEAVELAGVLVLRLAGAAEINLPVVGRLVHETPPLDAAIRGSRLPREGDRAPHGQGPRGLALPDAMAREACALLSAADALGGFEAGLGDPLGWHEMIILGAWDGSRDAEAQHAAVADGVRVSRARPPPPSLSVLRDLSRRGWAPRR